MIETVVKINDLQKAILHTLIYFDVFNYPINEQEVFQNCSIATTKSDIKIALDELLVLGYVKQIKGMYMLLWADVGSIQRREEGNRNADIMMETAFAYSKKVAQLPFVKGLCISGGLSKNYFDEFSDIDFFVITKANRLWLCRSLFILFYKTLSKHKKKFYCLNYFISESDLRIEDKNVFVATELSHLIPTVNHAVYKELLKSNLWYKQFISNMEEKPNNNCIETSDGFLKKFIEIFFVGKFGNWIDDMLMNRTSKRWDKQFASMDRVNFENQFRAKKNSAKRHVKGHQNLVLVALEKKKRELEDLLQLKLN